MEFYTDILAPSGGLEAIPNEGYVPLSCKRCAMRHWEYTCVESRDGGDTGEEDGSGRDVFFSAMMEIDCPLCHKTEDYEEDNIYGRVYGEGVEIEMGENLNLSASHFERVVHLDDIFNEGEPDCMKLVSINKAVAVNKGQSSVLLTLDGCIVFDTGHKMHAHAVAKAASGIESILGSELDEKETLLLISHADADHCSGVRLVRELVCATKVMFFHPRNTEIIRPKNLKAIAESCHEMEVSTFVEQLQEFASVMKIEKTYWCDYLLLPAKAVAQRAWTGHTPSKNDSSVCLLRCDTLDKNGEENRMWIGIAADRDYAEFINAANAIPEFSGTFDILSLPHHGSHLSTSSGTILACADFYVVQGTPTCRPTDCEAHLNIISLVLTMLDNTPTDFVVRNSFATLVFTYTLLEIETVGNLLRNHTQGPRLTILAANDCTVEFSLVPIPGNRKAQVFVRDLKWVARARSDETDYSVW